MNGGYFLHAGSIFLVATEAYKRTERAASDREYIGNDALIAIIFSAVALEAFFNEMAHLATSDVHLRPPNPPSIGIYAKLAAEVEEAHGSIALKILMARGVLGGTLDDKGTRVYEEFKLLMDLRNALVHLKPVAEIKFDPTGNYTLQPTKIRKRLRAKNILVDPWNGSWLNAICTRAAARWACNVAADVVHSIVDSVPDGFLKASLGMQAGTFTRLS